MPLPRFERLQDEKKQSILDAAAAHFADHGFEQASYNAIIKAAGLSKGAMYYYFADKDDLFRTVLMRAMGRWLAVVGMPGSVTDAAAFWRECDAMYRRIQTFMRQENLSARLCLGVSRARVQGDAHPALTELDGQFRAWFEGIARFGQGIGAVRRDVPIELMVEMGFGVLDGLDRYLLERWDQLGDDDFDRIATQATEALKRLAAPAPG